MRLLLVLGNQLFSPEHFSKVHPPGKNSWVFMREDAELCTYYKFHKHKIVFFLAAMRAYAEELRKKGYQVHYEELDPKSGKYEKSLAQFCQEKKVSELLSFEIEDKFFETRLKKLKGLTVLPSPMFLTSRDEFQSYLTSVKRPFMKDFYERQRKRLKILVDSKGKPVGGQWSFDADNRLALPKTVTPPPLPVIKPSKLVLEVCALVDEHFPKHPGATKNFWLPVTRKEARDWLDAFLEERLSLFGPYEDAIPMRSDFLFHSVLTPFLNVGLLTPAEVIEATLEYQTKAKTDLSSLEGFVRQIIGWREFIRGIYQNFSEQQETSNFWKHDGKLTASWYTGDTGVPPLDNLIQKTNRFAYAHHIERLMVGGNLMLLSGVAPQESHRWFMEMFIDSSDWVMGPNVYGMALFSDGGIFATKPYICGSNYFCKMGGYKKDDLWSDGVDGLYWGFIEEHREYFAKNYRLSMAVRTVEKMDQARKTKLYRSAEKLRAKLVL